MGTSGHFLVGSDGKHKIANGKSVVLDSSGTSCCCNPCSSHPSFYNDDMSQIGTREHITDPWWDPEYNSSHFNQTLENNEWRELADRGSEFIDAGRCVRQVNFNINTDTGIWFSGKFRRNMNDWPIGEAPLVITDKTWAPPFAQDMGFFGPRKTQQFSANKRIGCGIRIIQVGWEDDWVEWNTQHWDGSPITDYVDISGAPRTNHFETRMLFAGIEEREWTKYDEKVRMKFSKWCVHFYHDGDKVAEQFHWEPHEVLFGSTFWQQYGIRYTLNGEWICGIEMTMVNYERANLYVGNPPATGYMDNLWAKKYTLEDPMPPGQTCPAPDYDPDPEDPDPPPPLPPTEDLGFTFVGGSEDEVYTNDYCVPDYPPTIWRVANGEAFIESFIQGGLVDDVVTWFAWGLPPDCSISQFGDVVMAPNENATSRTTGTAIIMMRVERVGVGSQEITKEYNWERDVRCNLVDDEPPAPLHISYVRDFTTLTSFENVSELPTVTGGTAVSFAVTSGSLPGGLALNTGTGLISGVVFGAGSGSFVITVTDLEADTAGTSEPWSIT